MVWETYIWNIHMVQKSKEIKKKRSNLEILLLRSCYKLKSKNIYKTKTKFKVQRFKISDSKLGYTQKSSEIKLNTLYSNEELVSSVLSFYGNWSIVMAYIHPKLLQGDPTLLGNLTIFPVYLIFKLNKSCFGSVQSYFVVHL